MMDIEEEKPLTEAGVEFYTNRFPHLHPLPRVVDTKITLSVHHHPTGTQYETAFYIEKGQPFESLIHHWNRTNDYEYKLIRKNLIHGNMTSDCTYK